MARPSKPGLEYYPQDTDIHNDRKIRRLRKEYCGNGYMVYDYIKCLIYKENGYWIDLNDELVFDVADFLGCSISVEFVKSVIDFCCIIDLFNKEKCKNQSILTSSGIQKRFLKAKRGGVIAAETTVIAAETRINLQKPEKPSEKPSEKQNKPEKKNIINDVETPVNDVETPVNDVETPVNDVETPVNDVESTQSKLKESKVNNNNNIIIKKNEENEFEHKCKFYNGNWGLATDVDVCNYFFFHHNRYDKIRNDCLNVLSIYSLHKEESTRIEVLKMWASEFDDYLQKINKQKSMEGNEGYPFHFFSWLKKQGVNLKTPPKKLVKTEEIKKEKTFDEYLANRD
jgi:hypothetical protein